MRERSCWHTVSHRGKRGIVYKLKTSCGIGTMLQIFEIFFLLLHTYGTFFFFFFSPGVSELWYSGVKCLEREEERRGLKTKEQIAAKSLCWDSVVVQIERTFFQAFLLINFLFKR